MPIWVWAVAVKLGAYMMHMREGRGSLLLESPGTCTLVFDKIRNYENVNHYNCMMACPGDPKALWTLVKISNETLQRHETSTYLFEKSQFLLKFSFGQNRGCVTSDGLFGKLWLTDMKSMLKNMKV